MYNGKTRFGHNYKIKFEMSINKIVKIQCYKYVISKIYNLNYSNA